MNPDKDMPKPVGVGESAVEFTGVSEAYRRYIQEGLDDVAAGRVHDWEEVEARLLEKYGDLLG